MLLEDGEIYANPIDWHDFVVVETIDFPIEEQIDIELSMKPTKTANAFTAPTPKTAPPLALPSTSADISAATANGRQQHVENCKRATENVENWKRATKCVENQQTL